MGQVPHAGLYLNLASLKLQAIPSVHFLGRQNRAESNGGVTAELNFGFG